MAIHLVILLEPNEDVDLRIDTTYPRRLRYSRTLYLLEADELAEEVAVSLGIKGDNRIPEVSGFVLSTEAYSYSGYTTRGLWDWFKSVEKKS